jgi:hypothetical protein
MKTIDIVLLVAVFAAIYFFIDEDNKDPSKESSKKSSKKSSKELSKEEFNMDKIYFKDRHIMNDHGEEKLIETKKIKFDYNERPIDKKFEEQQQKGMNINTWYPNTWIEKIDENDKPVMNSREKVTGAKTELVDSNVRNTPEFNQMRPSKIDRVVDPEDAGKPIKDIYDNSFIDYKKTIPTKEKENIEEYNNMIKGASGLNFLSNDNWVYKDERPENGGIMDGGIYAADMSSFGSVATI